MKINSVLHGSFAELPPLTSGQGVVSCNYVKDGSGVLIIYGRHVTTVAQFEASMRSQAHQHGFAQVTALGYPAYSDWFGSASHPNSYFLYVLKGSSGYLQIDGAQPLSKLEALATVVLPSMSGR
jgi:hypothetical protein